MIFSDKLMSYLSKNHADNQICFTVFCRKPTIFPQMNFRNKVVPSEEPCVLLNGSEISKK